MAESDPPKTPDAKANHSLVMRALDSALKQADKAATPLVEGMRRRNSAADDAAVLKRLDKYFLSTVGSSGAATGASAAVPAVGTMTSLGLAAGDTTLFLSTAATYVLAVSKVHDAQPTELEHQRALVLAILMGSSGSATVTKIAGRTGGYWGRTLANAVPLSSIRAVNKVLGPSFVTRYGTRTGILVLGKAMPFGVGAVLGGGGNLAMASLVIKSTRAAFGPLPSRRSKTVRR